MKNITNKCIIINKKGKNKMEIIVCVLMVMLIAAQLFLAAKQIKKKAPDGKILLTINLAVITIWAPLAVCMFVFNLIGIKIAWFVISAAYMLFAMWYTKQLRK